MGGGPAPRTANARSETEAEHEEPLHRRYDEALLNPSVIVMGGGAWTAEGA